MQVIPVSPADVEAFSAWFAVRDACLLHDVPDEEHGTLEEQRALHAGYAQPDSPVRTVLLSAIDDDGAVAGAVRIDLPQRDNTHRVDIEVHVLPARRRRGIGTALLGEVRRLALADGRSTVLADVDLPRGREAGHGFALRHGATCEQTDVRRVLALPPDAALLAALEEQAREHAQGYEVVTWRDHVPEELLEDRALLEQRMSTDAPVGGLDWREEAWDSSRLRAHEDLQLSSGRTLHSAGAVHLGRLVAFTDIAVLRAQPRLAQQWNTLVLREHRGHRLGLLVKLASLRLLLAQEPQATAVVTWNAQENEPMIAVNEALGFQVSGGSTAWSLAL